LSFQEVVATPEVGGLHHHYPRITHFDATAAPLHLGLG
jgi:hypothetical protein